LRDGTVLIPVPGLIEFNQPKMTMTKFILKSILFGLLAAAVASSTVSSSAKDTNAPAAEKSQSKTKKSSTLPFHGKLKAVDQTAKTVSVGEHTIQITSETLISKGSKSATLEEGVVGEEVSGAYKKADDGKLIATKMRFGPNTEKSDKAAAKKEKPKTE
jgi:hypothetical protein